MGHPVACRIELRKDKFSVEKLIPQRFNIYGLGSFLENIKLGEVSMNKAAFDYLAQCPERRGLMGLEIFPGPALAYGWVGPKLIKIPKEEVSVEGKVWKKFSKLVFITE